MTLVTLLPPGSVCEESLGGLDQAARQLCALLEERLRTSRHFEAWLKSLTPFDVVGRASGGMDRVVLTYLRRTMPLVPAATFLAGRVVGHPACEWVLEARFGDGIGVCFPCEPWLDRVMQREREFAEGVRPDLTWRPGDALAWLAAE